jgi:uncharacterized repeat protein (TIGR01451 family)
MFMKKLSLFILSLILLSFVGVAKANADCSQIYGGGTVCPASYAFTIQKFVQTPVSGGNFVSNLSINDPRFSPNQTVNFQIVVQNTGSNTIPTLTVVDTFPQFLNYVSGAGSFDSNAKTLTFTINNLGAGASQTYNLSAKTVDVSLLPSDQGIVCVINQATGTDNNGLTNTSSSQLCIQSSVLGTSVPQVQAAPRLVTTPATGPEMIPLLGLIPAGFSGLLIRRKSNKKTLNKGGEK